MLLSGSSLATILSLAYNIVIGWFLGPRSFGHATVVYSLLVLLSAVSFAFQIVAAKMVAQQPSAEMKARSIDASIAVRSVAASPLRSCCFFFGKESLII